MYYDCMIVLYCIVLYCIVLYCIVLYADTSTVFLNLFEVIPCLFLSNEDLIRLVVDDGLVDQSQYSQAAEQIPVPSKTKQMRMIM